MILRMRCCFLMVGVIGGLPQIAHLQLVYKSIWQWIKSLTVWSVVSSQDSTLRQKEDHKLQFKKRSPKKSDIVDTWSTNTFRMLTLLGFLCFE